MPLMKSLLQHTAGALMSAERLLRRTRNIDPASVTSVLILEYYFPSAAASISPRSTPPSSTAVPTITITVATHGLACDLLRHNPHIDHLIRIPDPIPISPAAARTLSAELSRRNLHPDCTLTGVSDQRTRGRAPRPALRHRMARRLHPIARPLPPSPHQQPRHQPPRQQPPPPAPPRLQRHSLRTPRLLLPCRRRRSDPTSPHRRPAGQTPPNRSHPEQRRPTHRLAHRPLRPGHPPRPQQPRLQHPLRRHRRRYRRRRIHPHRRRQHRYLHHRQNLRHPASRTPRPQRPRPHPRHRHHAHQPRRRSPHGRHRPLLARPITGFPSTAPTSPSSADPTRPRQHPRQLPARRSPGRRSHQPRSTDSSPPTHPTPPAAQPVSPAAPPQPTTPPARYTQLIDEDRSSQLRSLPPLRTCPGTPPPRSSRSHLLHLPWRRLNVRASHAISSRPFPGSTPRRSFSGQKICFHHPSIPSWPPATQRCSTVGRTTESPPAMPSSRSPERPRNRRKVQQRGGKFICDRGSTNRQLSDPPLREEYQRWKQEYTLGRSPRDGPRELIYQQADAIVVPSQVARRSFLAEGYAREKIHVIPYGVRLESFRKIGRSPLRPRRSLRSPLRRRNLPSQGHPISAPGLRPSAASTQAPPHHRRRPNAFKPFLATLPQDHVEFLGPLPQSELAPT